MKSLVLASLLFVSTHANAWSPQTQLNQESVDLLQVAMNCPTELARLAEVGARITTITRTLEDHGSLYQVVTEQGGLAPTFRVVAGPTLSIRSELVQSNLPDGVMDGVGSYLKYTCTLTE